MKKAAAKKKVAKVMREFKKGELNIGKSSKKVKSKKQAVAIAHNGRGVLRLYGFFFIIYTQSRQ